MFDNLHTLQFKKSQDKRNINLKKMNEGNYAKPSFEQNAEKFRIFYVT